MTHGVGAEGQTGYGEVCDAYLGNGGLEAGHEAGTSGADANVGRQARASLAAGKGTESGGAERDQGREGEAIDGTEGLARLG